jgi:tRNA threonylcarbamoyladenosine biosynthesis protein TsaB
MMDEPLQHAERLIPLILDLLEESTRSIQDIDLISVNRGPGSFTGLRIGLAVAKGLGQAIGKPVVGVEGTAAYRSLVGNEPRVCVVIASRRNLYYARWYVGDRPKDEVRVLRREEIVNKLLQEQRDLVVAGSGAASIVDAVSGHPRIRLAPAEALHPSALAVARLACAASGADCLFELEPVYVESVLA